MIETSTAIKRQKDITLGVMSINKYNLQSAPVFGLLKIKIA